MSESLETTKDIDAVDANGWNALHHAAKKGDVIEVERLLAAGANANGRTMASLKFPRNSTPLMVATRYKHIDVMRLLIDRGADIEARNDDGYGNENTPCVYNIMSRRWTALYFAACGLGSFATVDYLILERRERKQYHR